MVHDGIWIHVYLLDHYSLLPLSLLNCLKGGAIFNLSLFHPESLLDYFAKSLLKWIFWNKESPSSQGIGDTYKKSGGGEVENYIAVGSRMVSAGVRFDLER